MMGPVQLKLTRQRVKGIKVGCAGHDALMLKGGYAYGYYPMGGSPDTLEKARPWHEIGNEPVGFYASQHTGSENPQFVRMQHGMLSYLSGLTMTFSLKYLKNSRCAVTKAVPCSSP